MKNKFFYFLLVAIVMQFGEMVFAGMNDASLSVSVGGKHYRGKDSLPGSSALYEGSLWGAIAKYKYQVPERFYARVRCSYYEGKLTRKGGEASDWDGVRTHYHERQINGALGYTFGFRDGECLLSPFLSAGWFHDTEYRCSKTGKFAKYSWYGFLAMLGIDLKYLITDHLSVGIIASVGSLLNSQDKTEVGANEAVKVRHKLDLCYEVIVPLIYLWNNFMLGVEINHARKNFHDDDVVLDMDHVKRTYGAAVNAGWTF